MPYYNVSSWRAYRNGYPFVIFYFASQNYFMLFVNFSGLFHVIGNAICTFCLWIRAGLGYWSKIQVLLYVAYLLLLHFFQDTAVVHPPSAVSQLFVQIVWYLFHKATWLIKHCLHQYLGSYTQNYCYFKFINCSTVFF